jgi:hypothetical protein
VELCACSVVNSKCRWNCLRAQYIIMCACLVVDSDCKWNDVRVQQFIVIVGGFFLHVYLFIAIVAGIVFLLSCL